jgi:hypothetical protein
MSSQSIPIGRTPRLPDNCQYESIGKIVCVYEDEITQCEAIGDNKFLCGAEYQECEITETGIACTYIAESVDWKGQEQAMQDVFIGHAYLVVIAAILSLALTQIIKPFIFKTCKEKADAVIRLVAVLTGAGIAYSLSNPFEMIDVYLGASAGAINAFVIKMFKAKVKKSLGVDETLEENENE